jgi:hypothetical protein
MVEKGVRKPPGIAWIEHGGKIHKFIMADTSHESSPKMYQFSWFGWFGGLVAE